MKQLGNNWTRYQSGATVTTSDAVFLSCASCLHTKIAESAQRYRITLSIAATHGQSRFEFESERTNFEKQNELSHEKQVSVEGIVVVFR